MLHMVVMTHAPESCPFRSEGNDKAMGVAFARLLEVAEGRGARLEGAWANTASHRVFLLVDAPNAHVVDQLIEESGLVARGTTTVYSVTTMEDQLAGLAR